MTGLRDKSSLNSPSFGRPRWLMIDKLFVDLRISKIVGRVADNLSSFMTTPSSIGTFKSTLNPTCFFSRKTSLSSLILYF